MAITAATLLLVGCFSSRKGTKDGNTVLATEDPFAKTDEVTINFKKFKGKDWHYPLEGAKVIGAFDGTVTFAGVMSGYGNVVFVSHPSGLETRYAHNSKNIAKKGEKVKAGDVVALEGKTGNATTEHVHFETRIGGQAFDSELIFDHKKNTLRDVKLTAKKRNGTVEVKVK